MRTIEEIKADIERCKKCDFPTCTLLDPEWRDIGFKCVHCPATYKSNLKDFELELLQAITSNIPLDRLETICKAENEKILSEINLHE